jgi:membrane glycosyltransferase
LLLIPEEAFPPRELRWLRSALRRAPERMAGFLDAAVSPLINALACAAGIARESLPPATREARRRALDRAVTQGPARLSDPDRNVVLSDPIALSRLHAKLWANPEAHRDWQLPP